MSEQPERPKVFITNDPGTLDFTELAKYGDVWKLSVGSVDPFRPHLVQQQITHMLDQNFDADRDYIVPAGAVLSVAFAFAWLGVHAENSDAGLMTDRANVKLLLFDSKKRDYMVRVVAL